MHACVCACLCVGRGGHGGEGGGGGGGGLGLQLASAKVQFKIASIHLKKPIIMHSTPSPSSFPNAVVATEFSQSGRGH